MGKYLWPDVPGNPASALRWVYLAGKGWLAPTVLEEHPAVLPLVLKVWADGITDKGDYRPLELEPGSSASWPGALWSGWSKI